jgi:hypothetical protein
MSTIRSTSTPPTGQTGQTARPGQTGQTVQAASGTNRLPTERIAQRAYEKWLKRGCVHGYDTQDWVEAEREILAEQSRSANALAGAAQQGVRR